MPPTNAPLFTLISARLGWLGQRQVILGQNLANADTPDYRPRDLRPADFARLIRAVPEPAGRIALARTDPGHLDEGRSARIGLGARAGDSSYETTPDGNAVILEEQMAKATADRARLSADQQPLPQVPRRDADRSGHAALSAAAG